MRNGSEKTVNLSGFQSHFEGREVSGIQAIGGSSFKGCAQSKICSRIQAHLEIYCRGRRARQRYLDCLRHHLPPKSLASAVQRSVDERAPVRRSVTTGKKDLDNLAGDVTVRYFMPPSAPKRAISRLSHIEHYGEDVTVRYFSPNPTLIRMEVTEGEVHKISEDVTVRYFRRSNLGVQREPIGSGGQQPFTR